MIFLKKIIKYLITIVLFFSYLFRSLYNYFKIKSSLDSIYIPNFAIKNTIYINPNKIKYANSIPMKFRKSTKFVLDYDWETNKNLETHLLSTVITCRELFIERKKIEECKNYFIFKDQLKKKKIYRNCKNTNDIVKFYKKKIELFKSIKKLGVKKHFRFNIQFMIDKNFNLVKINSGNHRMAMTRILKLKKIPIEIKIIHSDCFNQNIRKGNLIKKINKIIKDTEEKYA